MYKEIANGLSIVVFLLSLILLVLTLKKKKEGFEYGSNAYYRDNNNNPEYVSEYSSLDGSAVGDSNSYVGFGEVNAGPVANMN